jgi:tetratricopeptide (TPR) repeat protein
MSRQSQDPNTGPPVAGVTVVEAEPGQARGAAVQRWLDERRGCGDRTWHLPCDPVQGGPWAGMALLIEKLLDHVRVDAPELVTLHACEICLVLPSLRAELGFPESLTDTAADEEKTRNYASDRAYRCLHGLIELIGEWHELADPVPWAIACDGYETANGLVHRFFSELWRRRGHTLALRLLVTAEPGRGDEIAEGFEPTALVSRPARGETRHPAVEESTEAIRQRALALERQLDGQTPRDDRLPGLIDAWRRSDSPERALGWQVTAMARYNHHGLYEASLPYAAEVEAGLDLLWAQDPKRYVMAVNVLYFCHVPLGRAEVARPIVEQAILRVTDPAESARLFYLLSMLHARFLTPNDQERAEDYLLQALALVASGGIADGERQFLTVFLMNGLALVRVRQHRATEALELCREGIALLNEHLGPDRHRLHRSVLLFNIAQVHAQIGPYQDAIDYFTEAMALDPNYSEYYNDRGALYFKLGDYGRAEHDYHRAIELSPPYAEVWTNLGQCHRATGQLRQAVDAYSRAVDLDPGTTLALVGRAEANAALGRTEAALADYDRALALDVAQPLVLAGRAIVHYDAGRLGKSIEDLDAAVALAPDLAELYRNRAVALGDAGRHAQAAADLRTYLDVCPQAEDRAEVETTLAGLNRKVSTRRGG